MGTVMAGLLVFAVFVGPLIVRLLFDRRLERANIVAADVRAAVRRRLGGDSMVSVHVDSAGVWSARPRGRIHSSPRCPSARPHSRIPARRRGP
jgi:hypothetical protein